MGGMFKMLPISESDKRKIQALKNRTISNGNTLEEVKEAQFKIKKIMFKYEEPPNQSSQYSNPVKNNPYTNYNPYTQQSSPPPVQPQRPPQTPPFNSANSDIVDEFIKYRETNASFDIFMNIKRNEKRHEEEKQKEKRHEEEKQKEKRHEEEKQKEKRHEEEKQKSYITCPNCGGTKFYTNKYATKINETPLCTGCLKIVDVDCSSYIFDNGIYEYRYFTRNTTVKEIMDNYDVNFWLLHAVNKSLVKVVLKNEPIKSRIKFYIRLTLHRLNGILIALGI